MKSVSLILTALLPVMVLASGPSSAEDKLDATIFSFNGQDFVRTNSTVNDKGKSVLNTKLDPSSDAYKALVGKHSYTGPATVFGRAYDANYAPLVSGEGKLTGALFVGVPK